MTRERVNRNLYETKANDHFRTTVKAAAIAQLMLPTVDTLTGLALGIISRRRKSSAAGRIAAGGWSLYSLRAALL